MYSSRHQYVLTYLNWLWIFWLFTSLCTNINIKRWTLIDSLSDQKGFWFDKQIKYWNHIWDSETAKSHPRLRILFCGKASSCQDWRLGTIKLLLWNTLVFLFQKRSKPHPGRGQDDTWHTTCHCFNNPWVRVNMTYLSPLEMRGDEKPLETDFQLKKVIWQPF